ncbi:iron-sulfur cluster biosynthesis family protein [Limosilactobacillus antri]|uniref:iron-sulfur cluster biosynthesis family protein n=1 Tax=Limosilactobacillus antri TaxID=227943 RepID=UPI001F563623|nr:iron-sulfur cluster biosynthesis family protein [Limosilactobacillus antri]
MNVTFTDGALQRVNRYLSPDKKILLDYDDGVGPFSAVGNCSLDSGYQLIFVDRDLAVPDYDLQISSNIGPILIKGESRPQFEDEMEVRFNRHLFTMPLVSRKGVLTDNLEVVDYSGGPRSAQQGAAHDC